MRGEILAKGERGETDEILNHLFESLNISPKAKFNLFLMKHLSSSFPLINFQVLYMLYIDILALNLLEKLIFKDTTKQDWLFAKSKLNFSNRFA